MWRINLLLIGLHNIQALINQQHHLLSSRIRRAKLPVSVCSSAVQLHMRGKPKSVTVESRADQSRADFKKSRDGFVLLVPAN